MDLEPHPPNAKCEKCQKRFYVNRDNQRGSERRFCSARCRSAAYAKRRALALKGLEADNQSLRDRIVRMRLELDSLKG
jgi:hypothetical protein